MSMYDYKARRGVFCLMFFFSFLCVGSATAKTCGGQTIPAGYRCCGPNEGNFCQTCNNDRDNINQVIESTGWGTEKGYAGGYWFAPSLYQTGCMKYTQGGVIFSRPPLSRPFVGASPICHTIMACGEAVGQTTNVICEWTENSPGDFQCTSTTKSVK